MKNWFNSIPKEKIQRFVFIGLLVVVFAAFFISISLLNNNESNQTPEPNTNDPIITPDPTGNDTPSPSTPTLELFKLPITNTEYVINRKYYDINGTTEEQEAALIQFGTLYSMSKGISITSKDTKEFNVTSSLSGEVTEVETSPLYGVCVTIVHSNDVYTVYESLSEANVEVGDTVKQGDIIGVSGLCEFDAQAANHVYLKVMASNAYINPETVIGKSTTEIK